MLRNAELNMVEARGETKVQICDNEKIQIYKVVDGKRCSVTLNDVQYILDLKFNLLFVESV